MLYYFDSCYVTVQLSTSTLLIQTYNVEDVRVEFLLLQSLEVDLVLIGKELGLTSKLGLNHEARNILNLLLLASER